jgi:hypothetical protein
MKSDMRALLKTLAVCAVFAIVAMAILTAAALGAVSRDTAVYTALAVLVVGALATGRVFTPALVRRDRKNDGAS